MAYTPGIDVGTLKIIPEANRPSAWVLNGGTSTGFTDVDFGPYTPGGRKALLLLYWLQWTGNGAEDAASVFLRPNGSTVDSNVQNVDIRDQLNNLGAGLNRVMVNQVTCLCDSNGVIEYRFNLVPTTRAFYLTVHGYYS